MTLTIEQILLLTRQFTLVAVIFQGIELLILKPIYSTQGAWSWTILRQDYSKHPKLFQHALEFAMSSKGFSFLLAMQILIAAILFSGFGQNPWLYSYLFLTSITISLRFRGDFNGGSDAMMLVLLLSLTVIAWFPGNKVISNIGIFYIAIQSLLSYLVAGLVKIKSSEWRSGHALSLYLSSSMYDVPEKIRALAKSPRFMQKISWISILFELGFVSLFWMPSSTIFWILCGTAFHLFNFASFGLNRFFWAWIATYPSILWFAFHH